jgi:hypothetical protein
MKATLRLSLVKGQCFQGKTHWTVYAFDKKHVECAQKQPDQTKKRTAA